MSGAAAGGASAERWSRMWGLFHRAAELPASARQPFLDAACGGDEGLRREVLELLASGEGGDGVLDDPSRFLAEQAASILATLEPAARVAPGDVLAGRFAIDRELGSGGMGSVFAAFDRELETTVALKTLRAEVADHPDARRRFRREIQLARQVTHPNVCRLFDLFRDEPRGLPFLTMELLAGETLADRLEGGPLPPQEARAIARDVAAGLAAAHRVGVVHRDLKSGNVMLVGDRDRRAVITDFGLATSGEAESRLTLSGALLGTPAYMAPEQLQGTPATPATDVYALGLLLYEMLTGRLPFVAASPWAAAMQRVAAPAPSPRQYLPSLDPRWERAILRALEREPARRFGDARELVAALG